MKDQDLAQQLMATFLEELQVHVTSLGKELLMLEGEVDQQQRDDAWKSVFRSAHTLKGAAAVVQVEVIHQACHRMEDIFEYYRDRHLALPEDVASQLLRTVDGMEQAGACLGAEQDLKDSLLTKTLPELDQLAQRLLAEADKTSGDEADQGVAEQASNVIDQSESATDDDANDETDFEYEEKFDQCDLSGDSCEEESTEEEQPSSSTSINESLLPIFLEELFERCDKISEDAISMENVETTEQRQQLLTELFRSAHSLKGAAAVVKLVSMQTVCHALEDELDRIRSGDASFTSQTVTQLLDSVDAIQDAGQRLKKGESLEHAPITRMAAEIDRLKAASSESAAAANSVTTEVKPAEAVGDRIFAEKTLAEKKPGEAKPATRSRAAVGAKLPDRAANRNATQELAATIRVPAKKLDALLSHSGELLVARGRFSFRAEDIIAMRDAANELHRLWRASESNLREVMQVATERKKTDNGADRIVPSLDPTPLPKISARTRPSNRLIDVIDSTSTQLSAFSSRLDTLASEMDADNRMLKQTCDLLDDEIYHVRMLPFSDACGGLTRAVRDIATTTAKKIKLEIIGADVEVDRSVLEGLKDPLLHLVRNAADHGIESASAREAAGKSPMATIAVSAALRGGQVEVKVSDDGSGLDLERICSLARKREIDVPDDPREQARLIFAPGFSTAKMITDISGRGVGLDVVQNRVESLHGSVDVGFTPGKGTHFTVTVPLTLTTIRSMLVIDGGQTFAIPTSAIQSLARFGRDEICYSAGRECLLTNHSPVPVVSLARTLGAGSSHQAESAKKRLAIVLCVGSQSVAVTVDEVRSEQEVLVKNLGPRVRRLRHFSGCTLLPDGRVALVMNAANVIRAALGSRALSDESGLAETDRESKVTTSFGTILLAEDSPTTRHLLKGILESAGHHVSVAVDGQQAWNMLQEENADYDLVVTDIDMPRMDGFGLTQEIRRADSLAGLPVILVTARGSDRDKQHGIEVGANAYITKDSFEQRKLLETINQLI